MGSTHYEKFKTFRKSQKSGINSSKEVKFFSDVNILFTGCASLTEQSVHFELGKLKKLSISNKTHVIYYFNPLFKYMIYINDWSGLEAFQRTPKTEIGWGNSNSEILIILYVVFVALSYIVILFSSSIFSPNNVKIKNYKDFKNQNHSH